MNSGKPPLRLRLVKVRVGKTDMWMLTSVLDRRKLTKKQIIRFYKMRWGIEVYQPECPSSAGLYQLTG